MRLIFTFLIFIITLAKGSSRFDENNDINMFLKEVVDFCKKTKTVGVGDTSTTIEKPEAIVTFGNEVEKLTTKYPNINVFLEGIKAKIKTDLSKQLKQMIEELFEQHLILLHKSKVKIANSASVELGAPTEEELKAKAKDNALNTGHEQFIKMLLNTLHDEDNVKYLFFSTASVMIGEIIKTCFSDLNKDIFTDLVACKNMIDSIVAYSTPFYKNKWFIGSMIFLAVIILSVSIFVVYYIKRVKNKNNTKA